MKDLFSGPLGRLNNHGGSRMFTTPNTINVPPEYEVKTDVPSVAEFFTCSLDGRLWVWKRSRRYYVSALRWDEDKQRLIFAGTTVLNNINIIGRGIDWILTDSIIIQPSDDEPYVLTANLFESNNITSGYSSLLSKVLSLQEVAKQYSLLHTVDNWNIIGNFLVRRADNTLNEAYHSLSHLRPLIPLEFHGASPYLIADYNISITQYEGSLFARGHYYIGTSYILPAVFAEDGSPQEFFLYISPDFIVSPYKSSSSAVTISDWDNLNILHTDEHIYCFLTEQNTNLDDGLCYSSDTPKLFAPDSNEWLLLADNGTMFIDTLNNSGLVLHDDNATFLRADNPSYECKGIYQWLAPARKVDAVTPDIVLSSWDNATLATHVQQGFYRDFFSAKTLPLTAKAYSGKRFSLCLKDNVVQNNIVQVNSIDGAVISDTLDCYKQPLEIKAINFFSRHFERLLNSTFPIFVEIDCFNSSLIVDKSEPLGVEDPGFYIFGKPYYGAVYYPPWGGTISLAPVLVPGAGYSHVPATDSWGNDVWGFNACSYNDIQRLFYIHPFSGEPVVFFEGNFFDTYQVPDFLINDWQSRVNFLTQDTVPDFDIPEDITIQDSQIGYSYFHYSDYLTIRAKREMRFKPICPIPDEISNWCYHSLGGLSLQIVQFPSSVPDNLSASAAAVFSEKFSHSQFMCDIPSVFCRSNGNYSGTLANIVNPSWLYLNYWNVDSPSEDNSFYKQGLHVAVANHEHFSVFRSQIYPEIFDFHAEVERSKLP